MTFEIGTATAEELALVGYADRRAERLGLTQEPGRCLWCGEPADDKRRLVRIPGGSSWEGLRVHRDCNAKAFAEERARWLAGE